MGAGRFIGTDKLVVRACTGTSTIYRSSFLATYCSYVISLCHCLHQVYKEDEMLKFAPCLMGVLARQERNLFKHTFAFLEEITFMVVLNDVLTVLYH